MKKKNIQDYNAIRHLPHGSSPKQLDDCWQNFFRAISKGKAKFGTVIDTGHNGWYPPSNAAILTSMEYDDIQALSKLHEDLKKAFNAYGKMKYQEGLKEGKNLLIQLNKGVISLKDFEKQ